MKSRRLRDGCGRQFALGERNLKGHILHFAAMSMGFQLRRIAVSIFFLLARRCGLIHWSRPGICARIRC